MATKRAPGRGDQEVEYELTYADGRIERVRVPALEVDRSGDPLDVFIFLAKKHGAAGDNPEAPKDAARTGRVFDRRTGERVR